MFLLKLSPSTSQALNNILRMPNPGFRNDAASSSTSTVKAVHCSQLVLPNRSLNWTHCGVPPFAPPFHSGPTVVTPQCAS